MADGVDDETWLHHLRGGDYSRWFRLTIKDDELAAEASQIEQDLSLGPRQSRAALRAAIEKRYSAPSGWPFSTITPSDSGSRSAPA
jgi:hypothetical protein